MIPDFSGFNKKSENDSTGFENKEDFSRTETGSSILLAATSFFFFATIVSRIFIIAGSLIFEISDTLFHSQGFRHLVRSIHHKKKNSLLQIGPLLRLPSLPHFVPSFLHLSKFSGKSSLLLQLYFHHKYLQASQFSFPNSGPTLFFALVGDHFCIARQGNFIVTFQAVNNHKVGVCLLQEISIYPCHFQVVNSDHLNGRICRIYHWAKHVEKGTYT